MMITCKLSFPYTVSTLTQISLSGLLHPTFQFRKEAVYHFLYKSQISTIQSRLVEIEIIPVQADKYREISDVAVYTGP